jgi:hypothetical protein
LPCDSLAAPNRPNRLGNRTCVAATTRTATGILAFLARRIGGHACVKPGLRIDQTGYKIGVDGRAAHARGARGGSRVDLDLDVNR